MELYYAIATEFSVPNEKVVLGEICDRIMWFRLWADGPEYTCKLNARKDRILRNSFRRA